MKSKEKNKKFVLSFDGKKVAAGLNSEFGDQDLFGHGARDQDLSTRQKQLEEELSMIQDFVDLIQSKCFTVYTYTAMPFDDLSHV